VARFRLLTEVTFLWKSLL